MLFNVLIIDQEYNYKSTMNDIIEKYYKDISIDFYDYNNFINCEDYALLIIDEKLINHKKILTIIESFTKNIIFIINDHSDALLKNNTDYILKPLDINNLILKIQDIKNTQNDILNFKEEEILINIVNGMTNPSFLTNGYNLIYGNNEFYDLLSCSSISEINNKYNNIGDIFNKKDDFIFNENDNLWLNQYDNKKLNKVCITDKNNIEENFDIRNIYKAKNNINIILLSKISEQFNCDIQLNNLLFIDDLTKLPNRTNLISKFKNDNLILKSIALIDIKGFREINDFFGNDIGDKLLIAITKLISKYCTNENNLILYKFPSDIYCLTNISLNNTLFLRIIKKIIFRIYSKVFNFDNYEIDTRIVAGISFSEKKNKLITASFALQAAKKDNKSYLVFYDELDNMEEYKNNILWAKKLKYALNNNNIVPYFQAIVDNETLKINKYECLVRMIDNDDVISPYFFINISKKTNQYIKITKIMIEKSFKAFDKLSYEFSINISYEDIEDGSIFECIKTNLKKYDVKNQVVFEILEDENIKNYDILLTFINKIKKLGCKVAIDDFGTGYSNFERLLKMNIDYLKIDASIIKNIAKDKNSYKIAKTITQFAKNLQMKTIAEFVENEEIFKIVKKFKIDYSQGYYFAKPISKPNATLEYKDMDKG